MRAKKGIMAEYAIQTKGYRIWISEEWKIIETSNVPFNENVDGEVVLGLNNKSKYTPLIIEELESDQDESETIISIGEEIPEAHQVEVVIPRNFKEISVTPEKDKWFIAIKEEMDIMSKRNIWKLTPRPEKEKSGRGCFPRYRSVALNPSRVSSVPLGIKKKYKAQQM
ncbi:hypothetical protein TNCV_4491071 [Trichonephila clavipes]|nr:hypothetical protein TNCV_4491071 [Trichonephila clavipes]